MIQELRDITTILLNTPPPAPHNPKAHSPASTVNDLLTLNIDAIDFRECIPGTVHERKLVLSMKEAQIVPKIITMAVICQDQSLNELPQYIFGVRKENSYEYFDEFRFKAAQRGSYNFVIGVKTPHFIDYKVNAKLLVTVQGLAGVIEVQLRQTVVMPFVKCCKELVTEEGLRMIKIASVKGKAKKETKVAFRCSDNLNFSLIAELLGDTEEPCKEIEVKPRMIPLGGKGMFVVSICTYFPESFTNQKLTVRKILVFQIKDTNCYFHFPVEVTFYPEGRQGQTLE